MRKTAEDLILMIFSVLLLIILTVHFLGPILLELLEVPNAVKQLF